MATKAVDATQLDSDLTSVANVIRTKGGTSASMAFPAGFVSAVQNIPTQKEEQTKTVNISQNGTTTIFPDTGKVLSGATVNVNVQGGGVPLPSQIIPGDLPVILGTNGGYGVNDKSSFVLISEITIKKAGTYSFRWVATCQGKSTGYYYTRILKNRTQVGSDYDVASKNSHSQIYNISMQCNAGDVVAVYCKAYSSTYDVSVSGFMACIDWDNTF